jgi:hypothetical protein
MSVLDTSKTHSMRFSANEVRKRPFLWLNLVCLDAPLVAVVWQELFARTLGIPLSLPARQCLFFTAWLIYLVDRLVDSLSMQRTSPTSARQKFCYHHRNAWMALIVVIALVDAAVAFGSLERETFICGMVLGAIAAVYLVLNLAWNQFWRTVPLKEVCVGFLFAIGTLIAFGPPIFHINSAFIAGLLFAIICSLNCMNIAVWERDLDQAQGKTSLATRWPRLEGDLTTAGIGLSLASAGLASINVQIAPIAFSLGLSAILLTGVRFWPIPADERTALADLVLLTPAIVLVAGKFL